MSKRQQPKYQIGQAVVVIVETRDPATEKRFENEIEAVVSVIKASGTSGKNTYEYGITTDMPGCYHYGKPPFKYIYEDKIVLAGKNTDDQGN
jgi:hypothetical protein